MFGVPRKRSTASWRGVSLLLAVPEALTVGTPLTGVV